MQHGTLVIADCQLPIADLNAHKPKIGNRQLAIGNEITENSSELPLRYRTNRTLLVIS
jgi:hypothetical protein